MHRPPPPLAAHLAALLLIGLTTIAALAGAPEPLDQARSLLEKGQAGTAVGFLEDALTATPADRQGALLELLRQAYVAAAREAEARGQTSNAELYRDNLDILNRSHPAPRQPALNQAPERASSALTSSAAAVLPSMATPLPQSTPTPSEALVAAIPPAKAEALAPAPLPPPAPALAAPAAPPGAVVVATADAAFRDKRYAEAGQLYASLDREGRLPTARRDHWAYCRWTEVVRRINAKPSTAQEWAEIDAEIQRIRALSPNNWYGEYLRNRAAERSSSGGRVVKSNRLVIRGSAPEEAPLNKAKSKSAVKPAPAPVPAPAQQPAGGGAPQWQVRETTSFRILHVDPDLAEKAAEGAEGARSSQLGRWAGPTAKAPWTPKCEIYLYPTARVFSRMTGQPEESPGFSTMGMNGGKIIARRVNLRVDHPNLLKAILPHEITHVVLADLFPHQQIPRWADEGMAVLAEPSTEQHLRAADLTDPLSTGQLFKLEHLMAMDYPENKYWGLYYAQSVSLTRFLVEQANPAKFIEFVQRSQLNGLEPELKRVYNIDSFADLQNRWLTYARNKSSEMTAAATKPDQGSASPPR